MVMSIEGLNTAVEFIANFELISSVFERIPGVNKSLTEDRRYRNTIGKVRRE